ncbi:glycerophosphoryl diester phosphodiesterase [Nocardioides daedukensis]|uniref:glycerophosphodiester phosphodiesterase n=1 Tax=Nocardioides daedukensis TaxID=634462 RepID=A0A7Y9S0S4_9ACTN|nr:glycerophosphodiester phosphodiesterase [Nocardioides daedukensis]NYG60186.1 glycerophosphoryl diester phosphodiesterase [Nocardioides daedukensis]
MTSLGKTLATARPTLVLAASALAASLLLVPAGTATADPGAVSSSSAKAGKTAGKAHGKDAGTPQIIAHRGASGYRPEHTLAAYQLAIRHGADYVEPDLVSTKDGVLVARHENEISGTTDVADHPEFADRKATKTIDGRATTGWFTEDFTLDELKTLRAKERLPQVRVDNTRYDGRYEIPTFEEVLELVKRESKRTGRTIGVYPETKHPTYFDSIDLSLEEPLVQELREHRLDKKKSKVIIQSFETENLRDLDSMTRVPLAQLMDASGAPYDLVAAGDDRTYADLATAEGLREIADYADGVGAHKNLVLPRDAAGATGEPSAFVEDAHVADLIVHVWTIRDENQFMATNFRIGEDPNAKGDSISESKAFLEAGVDGLFSDHLDTALIAREEWLTEQGARR